MFFQLLASFTVLSIVSKNILCVSRSEEALVSYGPVEMDFVSRYLERNKIMWPEIHYVSLENRVELCISIYKSYKGITLGKMLRPLPSLILVPAIFVEVTFKLSRVQPKELEVLACGYKAMTFSNFYYADEILFIFKGVDPLTLYILKEGEGQKVHFVSQINDIDWEEYIDLEDE